MLHDLTQTCLWPEMPGDIWCAQAKVTGSIFADTETMHKLFQFWDCSALLTGPYGSAEPPATPNCFFAFSKTAHRLMIESWVHVRQKPGDLGWQAPLRV